MSYSNSFIFLLIVILFSSCQTEKDKLIVAYEDLYKDILKNDFKNIDEHLSERSIAFYNEITDHKNLNIDSILVLGKKYRLANTLVEYLAYNGDKIKLGNPKEDFFRYLGAQRISIFSYQDGYYVEKSKMKKGKENFLSLIKEDMSTSKRSWVQFVGNENSGYKLELLYSLELFEAKKKKESKNYRKQLKEKHTTEEYLRNFYWQHSGQNKNFDEAQLKLEASMREGRASTIQSFIDRGLIEVEEI